MRKDIVAVALATAITLGIYYAICTAIDAMLARLGGIL